MATVSLFLYINLRFLRSPYCNLLSPQNLAEVLFLIFPERLLVPREIEKNTEAKCCRANKVHYGQRESRK